MDWYFRSGIDDFVVPKDQELSDRLPSPESWSEWGISSPQNFGTPNKCFAIDANLTWDELNFNGEVLYDDDVEMETSFHDKDQSSGSSVSGGLEESQQTTLSRGQSDYQLDDLARIEQMDDIFLNSLLEDVTNAFSPSVSWEEGEVSASQFISCNSDQKDCPPVGAPLVESLVPSEQNSLNGPVCEEGSLEESVLQELEMVMAKLTDSTRICFRDAFYRLAKNSEQHLVSENREFVVEYPSPPWTGQDEKMRYGRKKATEIETKTNTIDRAIANLMFNKMDINVRKFPVEASMNSKQKATRATGLNYSSDELPIHHFPHSPTLPSEV